MENLDLCALVSRSNGYTDGKAGSSWHYYCTGQSLAGVVGVKMVTMREIRCERLLAGRPILS